MDVVRVDVSEDPRVIISTVLMAVRMEGVLNQVVNSWNAHMVVEVDVAWNPIVNNYIVLMGATTENAS